MGRDLVFTQCRKAILNQRKRLFLFAGILPIFVFFAFWTWIGSIGRARFGFGPEKVVFLMPVVMVIQMVLLATRMHGLRLMHLRLSTESIEIYGSNEVRQHLLCDLRKIRVVRGPNGAVSRIVLLFGRQAIRLSGYLEMDVLRDTLVRYASTGPEGQLRVIDPVR